MTSHAPFHRFSRFLTRSLGALALAALLVLAGCDSTTLSPGAQKKVLAKDQASLLSARPQNVHKALATLRRATACYHRVEAALEDGYVPAPFGCFDPDPSHPGTVGIPYVNADRIDLNINLAEPEVLFYEPQKNGKLRLVGAEPVVPIKAWDGTHDEPPSLFGRAFHTSAPFYGLHMWVWLHNPEGIFAFEHPKVSCEFYDG